jgi:small-conductance mechanosensitive channel
VDDATADGRDETDLERSDRNLDELMQEVRVVQTGIQILFGFLLTVAFQPKFARLSSFQKVDYFGTLLLAATTLVMLTAPSAWHRILFRRGDKTHLVTVANRFTMTGLATMGLTVIGVVMLLSDIAFRPAVTVLVTAITVIACATAWYVMPLLRRRQLERPRVTETPPARERRSKRQPGAA